MGFKIQCSGLYKCGFGTGRREEAPLDGAHTLPGAAPRAPRGRRAALSFCYSSAWVISQLDQKRPMAATACTPLTARPGTAELQIPKFLPHGGREWKCLPAATAWGRLPTSYTLGAAGQTFYDMQRVRAPQHSGLSLAWGQFRTWSVQLRSRLKSALLSITVH